jgi:hypothetical protein
VQRYREELNTLFTALSLGLIDYDQFIFRVKQLREQFFGSEDAMERFGETVKQTAAAALTSFVAFTLGAEGSFRDFVRSVLHELQQLTARLVVLSIFKALKIDIKGLTGFQHGGFLPPGEAGIVGERGPELVVAGRQGLTIIPEVPKGFQHGGFLPPGEVGIVGERRPEIAVAGRRGSAAVPFEALKGFQVGIPDVPKEFQVVGFRMPGEAGAVGERGPALVAERRSLTVAPSAISFAPNRFRALDLGEPASSPGGQMVFNVNVTAVDARSLQELLNQNPSAVVGPIVNAVRRSRALAAALG